MTSIWVIHPGHEWKKLEVKLKTSKNLVIHLLGGGGGFKYFLFSP